jgi:ABC-2 type transport system permease protein
LSLRTLTALIKKEVLQIIRDPSAILIAFILPLILLFIFGYGVNLDSNKIKIGLVIESDDPAIAIVTNAFLGTRFLDVQIARDRREFNEDLNAGRIRGIVVIPQTFIRTIAKGIKSVDLQVITDGSEPNIASFVNNYARGVVNVLMQQQSSMRAVNLQIPIQLDSRFWYNPELKSRNFLIPGSIAIIMTLIGTLLTALVIAREWERGTMEALMVTPISITELLLGKLIPYFILGMGSLILCLVIAHGLYQVPFRGTLGALVLVTSIFLIAGLGQGLLISAATKDQFVASQGALMSAFLPAFMLSGFIFEISAMPIPIQKLTYIFPARYYVTSLQSIFMTGNVWPLLIRCMLAIAVIGLILFIITSKKTTKRLD